MFRRQAPQPRPTTILELQRSAWSGFTPQRRREHLSEAVMQLQGRKGFRDYVDEEVQVFLFMVISHVSAMVVDLAAASRDALRRQNKKLNFPAVASGPDNPLIVFWRARTDEIQRALEQSLASSLGEAEIAYRRMVVTERLYDFALGYLSQTGWVPALEAECATFITAELRPAVQAPRGDMLGREELTGPPPPAV